MTLFPLHVSSISTKSMKTTLAFISLTKRLTLDQMSGPLQIVNQMKHLTTLLSISVMLLVACTSSAQTIRSGDGLSPGVPDPNVRFFATPTIVGSLGPMGTPAPAVVFPTYTSWPNARVIPRYGNPWVFPNTGPLTGAQWLSTATDSRNGGTAMYTHEFLYPHNGPADLNISYATDDQMWGVYLNGTLIHGGGTTETHSAITTISRSALPMNPNGINTLSFYSKNLGASAAGIIYSGVFRTREKPHQGPEEHVSGCCEGRNYVANPTFKAGNTGFNSKFTYKATAPLAIGEYGIFNGVGAWPMSNPNPVMDEVTGHMATGNFLVARVSKNQRVIWRQQINVPQGELAACVRVKPFYKDTGSWPPVNVTFRWTNASGQSQQHTKGWHPLPLPGAGGWHDFSGTFGHWVSGPVTMEILVDIAPGDDDPNRPIYIAIDNIALKPKTLVPAPTFLPSTYTQTAIGNGSTYNLTFAWPTLPMPPFAYFWAVEELDNNRNVIRSIINPSEWWWPGPGPNPGSFNFPGFDGDKPPMGPTFTLDPFTWSPMSPAGVFYSGRNYRITYGVWGKCHRWRGRQWEIGFFASAKTASVPPIKQLPDTRPGLPANLRGLNMNLFDEKTRPNRFDPSIMRKDRPMPRPNIPGNFKPSGGKNN